MSDEEAADGDLPAGDDDGHALSEADLQYPTIEFEEGTVESDGALDLSKPTDREAMSVVADAVAGALSSHDLGVSTPDGSTTFGIGPRRVELSFEPDENHRGELAITFRLSAKSMVVDDGTGEPVGARGDAGFVPVSMLTDDDGSFRCYSWIDDPESPE